MAHPGPSGLFLPFRQHHVGNEPIPENTFGFEDGLNFWLLSHSIMVPSDAEWRFSRGYKRHNQRYLATHLDCAITPFDETAVACTHGAISCHMTDPMHRAYVRSISHRSSCGLFAERLLLDVDKLRKVDNANEN
jgi:hypothetical protein